MKMYWSDEYKVHSYEIDEYSNASFTAICNFMQETAWNHAENLQVGFSQLIERGLVWVLSRQRIRVHRYPRWGDRIIVNTWPSGMDRMYCYRDFKVETPEHETLVTATSTWFVIDMKSRRPQRTETFIDLRPEAPERMFDAFAVKLDRMSEGGEESLRSVLFSDMDVNGHLNNVNYMKYVIDSMPREFIQTNRLTELEINYLNEGLYGDTVVISRQDNGNGEIQFGLRRQGTGEEMCRARTVWSALKS